MELYEQALVVAPTEDLTSASIVRAELGSAFLAERRWPDAEEVLERALAGLRDGSADEPSIANAVVWLAEAVSHRDIDAALTQLEESCAAFTEVDGAALYADAGLDLVRDGIRAQLEDGQAAEADAIATRYAHLAEPPTDPIAGAVLLHDMAVAACSAGRPEAGLELLERSLARKAEFRGAADPDTITTLVTLVETLGQGDRTGALTRLEAETAARAGSEIADEDLARLVDLRANLLGWLAREHWQDQRFDEAEAMFEQALAAARSIGEESLELYLLIELGSLTRDRLGPIAAIVGRWRDAHERHREALGADSPDSLLCLTELVSAIAVDDLDAATARLEAEVCQREGTADDEQLAMLRGHRIGLRVDSAAMVFERDGAAAALERFREAVRLHEAGDPVERRHAYAARSGLGATLFETGRHAEAVEEFEIALREGDAIFGADGELQATAVNNLTRAMAEHDIVAAVRRGHDEHDARVAAGMPAEVADQLLALTRELWRSPGIRRESAGELDDALRAYEAALAAFDPRDPGDEAVRFLLHRDIGDVLRARDGDEAAVDSYEAAFEGLLELIGPAHEETVYTLLALAEALGGPESATARQRASAHLALAEAAPNGDGAVAAIDAWLAGADAGGAVSGG